MGKRLHVAGLSALLLVSSASGRAADLKNVLTDYTLTSWNEKEGLPTGTIFALAQDQDGYLWVGSDAGLFRFDGVRFVPWSSLSSTALPAAPVRSLCAARDGTLWIGFGGVRGAIAHFARGTLQTYDERKGMDAGSVTTLLEHDEAIWAAGSRGLVRFKAGRWERDEEGLVRPSGGVSSAYADNHALVVATGAGVFRRADQKARFELITATGTVRALAGDSAGDLWATDPVVGFRKLGDLSSAASSGERGRGMRLLHDRSGNLWVATGGQGLWRVHRTTGSVPTVERSTSLTGLLGDGVYSLLEDFDGNIWAGTTEGLNRLTPRKITQIVDLGIVQGVEASPGSGVWVGTVDGLVEFSETGRKIREWTDLDGARLTALHVDEHGTLWVATTRSLSRFVGARPVAVDLPPSDEPRQIQAITSDGRGGVWLYDPRTGLGRWNGKTLDSVSDSPTLHRARVVSLFTDRTGLVWVAYSDATVSTIASTGGIRTYGPQDGLDAGVYSAIYEDVDGTIWLAANGGLSRFVDGRFTTVHAGRNFPAEGLTVVVGDGRDLWLGTVAGIVRLPVMSFDQALASRAVRFTRYERSDGIAGIPVPLNLGTSNRRVVRAGDGRLWFVTARGITIMDPRMFDEVRPPAPVRVETLVADNVQRPAEDDLVLPPRTRAVEIDYTSLDLTSPLKSHFRYRLEGFDPEWVDAGMRRQAFYTNLPPREYRFIVEASQEDGSWSEPAGVWSFSIQPTFYQTPWFGVLCALAVGLTVYGAWRFRLGQVRKQFALLVGERARLSREIHDTLLQSLVGVALQLDALADDVESSAKRARFVRLRKQVEEYIREARQAIWDLRSPRLERLDLADALREAGTQVVSGHPVAFAFATSGEPHRYSPRVEAQILRIGQEAVLNAVHHAHANEISIELRFAPDTLVLRVADDGCGFEVMGAGDDHHYGLMSMRERAEEVGGTLRVESGVGRGTAITAVVPMAEHA